MPYKKEYTMKNIGMGNTRTKGDKVMGSQGKSAPLKLDYFRNRPTGNTPFPGKAKSTGKKKKKSY